MTAFHLRTALFAVSSALLFASAHGHAQSAWKDPLSSPGGALNYKEKAEKKKGSRWTLAEWLEQKERNKMMDLWLGMYAPSPYEFYLEGIYSDHATETAPAPEAKAWGYSGRLGINILVVGFEFGHQNNWIDQYNENYGQVRLRVLGNAVQGTHLILGYGQKQRSQNGQSSNQGFATADFDVYIERHSGLHLAYRADFAATSGAGTTEGNKLEGGLFFDIDFLQLFGRYFVEKSTLSSAGVDTPSTKKGIESGIRLFF